MQIIFEQMRVGGDRNFGYLLGDRDKKQAVLIDPSYSPKDMVERATVQGLTVTHVLNTHGHPDHTNGNRDAVELTGAVVAAHTEAPTAPDLELSDEKVIALGEIGLDFHYNHSDKKTQIKIFNEQLELAKSLNIPCIIHNRSSDK